MGDSFPGINPENINNTDLYAIEKELYLGSLCEVADTPRPWQFWMVMLKNGNYDTRSGLCPQDGKKVPPFSPGRFPCFGQGCMNQPILCHQWTQLKDGTMQGGFSGTYDLDSGCGGEHDGVSYYEVVWEKKVVSISICYKKQNVNTLSSLLFVMYGGLKRLTLSGYISLQQDLRVGC